MRALLRLLFRICFRFQVYRPELLPKEGPALVMPNHLSFLDGIFLFAFLPSNTCFVINKEIAEKLSWGLRWFNHMTIDPLNPFSLKEVIHQVKAGRVAVIFPEGRISTTGGLMKVYNGVALIAVRTGAPLVPIIFQGLERTFFSRFKNQMPPAWFPKISMHVFPARCLKLREDISFRLQKHQSASQILRILQESLFQAKEEREIHHNFYDKLREIASQVGMSKVIAEDISGKATYRKILQSSYALGKVFQKTMAQEERIGLLLPNSIAHVAAIMGLSLIGKTPAILNFTAGEDNILYCCKSVELQTVITSRRFVEQADLASLITALEKSVRVLYLEDLASEIGIAGKLAAAWGVFAGKKAWGKRHELILFTSGSESRPKGVVLEQRAQMANLRQISSVIDYSPADRLLNALPMFHSFGLTVGVLLPLLSGMYVYLYPSPLHYRIVPEIAYDRNITALLGTPTFLAGYARFAHNYDFYRMRLVIAGGEKLTDGVRNLWMEKYGLRIFEGYGTTETGPVLAINTPLFSKNGTVGHLLPGVQWKLEPVEGIEEGGNLLVQGPNVMQGYLREGRPFEPVGQWYDCGDVVVADEEQFFRIAARLKRFAKISGEMVSLDSVEKWASNYSEKGMYGAVAVRDGKKGEQIYLYTTVQDLGRDKLRAIWSENGFPMLALPGQIIPLEKWPALASGKTDYQTLGKIANQANVG